MICTLQERFGSFMTAKGRLIEEMRKKGQTYRPHDAAPSSSQEPGSRTGAGLHRPFKNPALAGQKRSGQVSQKRQHRITSCFVSEADDSLYMCLLIRSFQRL